MCLGGRNISFFKNLSGGAHRSLLWNDINVRLRSEGGCAPAHTTAAWLLGLFSVRWIRLTVKKCGITKKRAASTEVKAAPENVLSQKERRQRAEEIGPGENHDGDD